MINKKQLSEQDIRTRYITPAIVETTGWDKMRQLREEVYFTDGPIWVRGNLTKRGKAKNADPKKYLKIEKEVEKTRNVSKKEPIAALGGNG